MCIYIYGYIYICIYVYVYMCTYENGGGSRGIPAEVRRGMAAGPYQGLLLDMYI